MMSLRVGDRLSSLLSNLTSLFMSESELVPS